jgi:hypothetical protein
MDISRILISIFLLWHFLDIAHGAGDEPALIAHSAPVERH